MATTIAVTNRKGGVGKTTTTINVGAALARRGLKTLIVDVDPQRNLSRSLRVEAGAGNTYDVLQHNKQPQAVGIVEGLDLLPATGDLAFTEIALASAPDGKQRLRNALAGLASSYDYVLIDTAPALGLLTINALTAADFVLVPLQAEYLALQGLSDLLQTITDVRAALNTQLALGGVILTRYDSRLVLSRKCKADVEAYLRAYGSGHLFAAEVRNAVAVAEAQACGVDVYRYAPNCNAAQAYTAIADELVKTCVK